MSCGPRCGGPFVCFTCFEAIRNQRLRDEYAQRQQESQQHAPGCACPICHVLRRQGGRSGMGLQPRSMPDYLEGRDFDDVVTDVIKRSTFLPPGARETFFKRSKDKFDVAHNNQKKINDEFGVPD